MKHRWYDQYNILTKFQEMTMVNTTYKLNNKLSNNVIFQTLIVRFTGQLKGRWDNYLPLEDKSSMLKANETNSKNEIVRKRMENT